MQVIALASGSSGNATLIKSGNVNLLFDAGVPTRVLERSLRTSGVEPAQIAALLLTHEHSDHVAAAGVIGRRYHVPIVANERTLRAVALGKATVEHLPTGSSVQFGGLHVRSFHLPHDARDTVGYWIQADGASVCLATDLGHVPPELLEYVGMADLLILEANHDRDLLLAGPYPPSLKTRILGPSGHLSNQQAAECIAASASGRPQQLWLAHLSAINNSTTRALSTVLNTLRAAGIKNVDVAPALRDHPSLTWNSAECFLQPALGL